MVGFGFAVFFGVRLIVIVSVGAEGSCMFVCFVVPVLFRSLSLLGV